MRPILALIFLLFTPVVAAKCLGDYPAPDGSAMVKISALNEANESLVQFIDAHGKLLHTQDYSSPEKDHGSVAYACGWTADSKFFVYSTYSSGGHQAWHFGTLFYAPETNRLYSLDDLVGPISDGDFSLKAPDIIETMGRLEHPDAVQIIRKADPDEPDLVFDVSLSQLLKNRHL